MAHCHHFRNRDGSMKVVSIVDWPRPTTVPEVRSFLGVGGVLSAVLRRFLKDCYPAQRADQERREVR